MQRGIDNFQHWGPTALGAGVVKLLGFGDAGLFTQCWSGESSIIVPFMLVEIYRLQGKLVFECIRSWMLVSDYEC